MGEPTLSHDMILGENNADVIMEASLFFGPMDDETLGIKIEDRVKFGFVIQEKGRRRILLMLSRADTIGLGKMICKALSA